MTPFSCRFVLCSLFPPAVKDSVGKNFSWRSRWDRGVGVEMEADKFAIYGNGLKQLNLRDIRDIRPKYGTIPK